MKIKSMHDLYLHMLQDIYYAENQLVKALPKMSKATTNLGLQQAIENHLLETKVHVERLERIFGALEKNAKGVKCDSILGLIAEAEDMMDNADSQDVMDAAIIAAAQKTEHYEIATYGTLVSYAKLLGYPDQAKLLMDTLKEERLADEKLTTLAEGGINRQASTIAA
ncbi:MAG TPA: ferritin-like domain-containing protein [Alphaproteobacteria bacterium]